MNEGELDHAEDRLNALEHHGIRRGDVDSLFALARRLLATIKENRTPPTGYELAYHVDGGVWSWKLRGIESVQFPTPEGAVGDALRDKIARAL